MFQEIDTIDQVLFHGMTFNCLTIIGLLDIISNTCIIMFENCRWKDLSTVRYMSPVNIYILVKWRKIFFENISNLKLYGYLEVISYNECVKRNLEYVQIDEWSSSEFNLTGIIMAKTLGFY